MFYTEFGFRTYRVRTSHYILRFVNHYDEYVNSVLVRSADYSQICLQ
ncbi:hypothetical protein SAMN05216466_107128 [Paraburkholderia phenazinium]|uniref:Uncharacterized protein n=1 Tax=Paraburkholderia phenazinium TaxID=60549 RepID=A0A1G7ZQ50_9BURK|nr:hypothetical protein [Paraburkholderia phenazinium]SDH10843.1 hypothetical protein SAMN05216466_107128 [Paraburkholderia phenazinium]